MQPGSAFQPDSAATLAIDVAELRFAWPGKTMLLDVERFSLAAGERVFLRGPSGSGKSTLLGLIGGILAPTQGSVRLLGHDLTRMSASARDAFRGEHLGFIFQMFNLIPYLSVLDNILLPTRFSPRRAERVGASGPTAEAQRLLVALGLKNRELWGRGVTQLSIGQQQRVAAARALLGRPEVIIADEPTSALDHDTREQFLGLLQTECRALGSSLLFVSHDTSLGHLFDRVVNLAEINRAIVHA